MILNLTSGRHLFFKRFLSRLLSHLDPALKSFSISLMFVVGLFKSVSGPVWVGEQWFKKKKSHLVLINLLKWSEHLLRESLLPVEKVEARALPFMQAARRKWMQTNLLKNVHMFKKLGVQGPQRTSDLTVCYPQTALSAASVLAMSHCHACAYRGSTFFAR